MIENEFFWHGCMGITYMITVDAKNIHTFTFFYGWQLFSGANSLTLSSARKQIRILKIFKPQFLIFQFSESKFLSRAVVEHIGEVIFIWITSWNSKKKAQQRLLSPLGPQGLTYCNCNPGDKKNLWKGKTSWYFIFMAMKLFCQGFLWFLFARAIIGCVICDEETIRYNS